MAINIPDRTFDNPFLNIQEMNQILQMLRQYPSGRMIDSSPYGTNYLPDNPYVGTICVKIDEEIPPNSIFTIKYVDQQFVAYIPTSTWEKYANPATIPPSKKLVYCTNMMNPGENGSQMDCMVVGDTIPRLIRFQGTIPIIGDRLSKVIGDIVIAKSDSGEFVAVSNGDATSERVWVVRQYESFAPQSLQLLRATDWMDVGGATTVKLWNNTDGNWTLDASLINIAQDIQHRSFLAPNDQCWGKFLGFTEEDHVAIYEVVGENGLHQYGKAVNAVDCGTEGTFEITTGLLPDNTDPTHQNVNWTNVSYDEYVEYLARRKTLATNVACPTDINHHSILACTPKKGCSRKIFQGEYVRLRYIVSNRKWEATPIPDTLFAIATLYAEMCPNNDAVLIGFSLLGCCGVPSITITEPAVGLNASRFKLAGKTGAKVLVSYTGDGDEWDVIQVQHEEIEIVEAIEADAGSGGCPALNEKVRKFALMTCVPEPEVKSLISFGSVEVVAGITANGCDLEVAKVKVCVAGVGAGSSVSIPLATDYIDVVTGFSTVDTPGSSGSSGEETEPVCTVKAETTKIRVCGVGAGGASLTVVDFQIQGVVHSIAEVGDDILVCIIEIATPCIGGMWCDPLPMEDCPVEGSSS